MQKLILSPRITFSIHDVYFENDIKIEIIEIETNNLNVPVKFKDIEYIRVNSTKQKLKDFPEKESYGNVLNQKFSKLK